MYLFIYGLFNDTSSSSDYIELNDIRISELWSGEVMEDAIMV
jgi:hypothetical protein